ncbi:MAG TPA: ABC transporter substrate-binding protein [Desulfuromonadales bacterium]|nr:ABC transporter substrate-binding protein [Desulfuromonadales bacterium]
MRRLVLLIVALATLLPSLAQAYDVLILQSRRDPAYEEVLSGFRSGQSVSQRVVVLADYAEVDVVRIVREDRPRMILAVGDAAVTASRTVRNLPVVSVLALGIHNKKHATSNLTGISMFAHPEQYVSLFKSMKIRRVGVVGDAEKSGWYQRLASKTAREAGIELVTREISAPHETVAQLETLAGKVDALWMLPDTTAVTRETSEAYFRFGQQNSVPVISFAPSYLGLGAAAVLEIDRVAMGRQAFALAAKLLNERSTIPPVELSKVVTVRTNPVVLQRMGLPVKLMSLQPQSYPPPL